MKIPICPQCKLTLETYDDFIRIRIKESTPYKFHRNCLKKFGESLIKLSDPMAFKDMDFEDIK